MIKEKEMTLYQNPYYYPDGTGITLDLIYEQLISVADEYQIPVQFYTDTISRGMISVAVNSLTGESKEECLVLYHPNHQKDYSKYVFRIGKQGTMVFVSVYNYGVSKNFKKLVAGGNAKKDLKKFIFNGDANESAKALGRAVAGGILSIGGSKKKRNEEEMWYAAIGHIIGEVIH